MGVVTDILSMQQQLAADRYGWEAAWRDCVDLCMPYASHKFDFGGSLTVGTAAALTGTYQQPRATQRSREIFDGTAVWAADRLTAGMESLITPRAQKWHSFSLDDAFAPDPTDMEEEWLDRLRDYCFGARYDAKSNFALANQKAIKSTVILGTGVLFSEENFGRKGIDPVKVPFFYRSVPLIECYLGIDAYDDVDKCIRVFDWTARAAVKYFDDGGRGKVSQKVRDAASDPKKQDQVFTFLHCVMPREDAEGFETKRSDQLYASFWCEPDTKHLVGHSGYFTFPYEVQWWDQIDGSAYGQSPVMSVMADIKMLQVMSKNAVAAAQQLIKPPMATMSGVYNSRLNLNPGAVNPGYLDETGRLKAQPIIQAQNPNLAENIMEMKRQGIRESLYVTLFQILVDNPQMTATEALIRANEKGELLGPAGAKIENGIARAIDREIDIIQRKGAFAQGSPLAPPPSIAGKNVGVKFTGPLARLRRTQEMQGVQTVFEMANVIGGYDPSVLDRIDADETLEITREIGGAPRKMFHTDEEVRAIREERTRQQEAKAAMEMASMAAGAARDATPAIEAMQKATMGRAA